MPKQDNKCTCKWKTCKRHGDCIACRQHHVAEKKGPPFCERRKKKAAEKEM